ncbi:translation initiation factor eaIF-5B [Methanolobus vulcani]|jgi:translation initiation factor 5B|uniref:Probable translation initiation factor IF-2 n=1 Tax=Methanolobus vulcani TaxID=38026 RepID=A0A7Z7B0D5_9EURY|nr:translation initiation factor IF-2 [Methanolobus vulcani]MDK2825685.1 translation initiation factor [Methanolobus sp.]MDK2947682.1 translation initiation factor [Methanolobus sp.]SDF97104.1 translation initiation factor eaIF-5B [Methanolobus vulcani]
MAVNENLRTPIVSVMGHVDHGKTTLLDRIRGSAVADGEAGAITQHIGATEVPIENIVNKCGDPSLKDKFIVPGLLFIDTPGHHAFTSLRSRGGALADLAIVIVDVNEGFMPQTIESLHILKRFKTPFVVVANKIDRIHGWEANKNLPFLATYNKQSERVKSDLDNKLYEVIGELYNIGFNSERYDRVNDFQRNIGVIPISAATGEGIPDVLMILLGLAQRFLEGNLHYDAKAPGIGTVLEVKEEKGLGTTLDIILYDGTIKKGDTIVVGSLGNPIQTKIRALLKPRPLSEIKAEEKFQQVSEVTAAVGVKISAPNLEGSLAGSPVRVVSPDTIDAITEEIKSEIEDVQIDTDTIGVTIKADTIGSLEALVNELKKEKIPIRKADVGDVSNRDIVEVTAIEDPFFSVIVGFNVKILPDAKEKLQSTEVKLFLNDVIYRLIDDYKDWVKKQKELAEKEISDTITKPGRFYIMPDCTFRQSKPAVVGVKIIGGVVRTGVDITNTEGEVVGKVKGLQVRGENVSEAKIGMEVAMAIEGPTVGRQIKEEDTLFVNVPERHAKKMEHEIYDSMTADELEALDAFLAIKRRGNPFWAK